MLLRTRTRGVLFVLRPRRNCCTPDQLIGCQTVMVICPHDQVVRHALQHVCNKQLRLSRNNRPLPKVTPCFRCGTPRPRSETLHQNSTHPPERSQLAQRCGLSPLAPTPIPINPPPPSLTYCCAASITARATSFEHLHDPPMLTDNVASPQLRESTPWSALAQTANSNPSPATPPASTPRPSTRPSTRPTNPARSTPPAASTAPMTAA